jgi:predicted amidohydrolase
LQEAIGLVVMVVLIVGCGGSAEPTATITPVPLTVATVSMTAVTDKQANLQKFFSFMEEAAEKGAHLIVFPEAALQQCPAWGEITHQPTEEELEYVFNTAEAVPGDSTDRLVEKARELNLYVIFGMTEKVSGEDSVYNTSVFLGPNGIIGKYRKMNLWDARTNGNEHLIWKPGTELGVFESPIGRVGLLICIDMYYRLGPKLAENGADLLVTVSGWPGGRYGAEYENATVINATIAERWHIISNLVGSAGNVQDYGHSRVIDPNGDIVADTGSEERMVIAETDLLIDAKPER